MPALDNLNKSHRDGSILKGPETQLITTETTVSRVSRHGCCFHAKGNATLDLLPSWLLTDCELRRDFLPTGSRYADGTQPSKFEPEMNRKLNIHEHTLKTGSYTINILVWGLALMLYNSTMFSILLLVGSGPWSQSSVSLHAHLNLLPWRQK